VHEHKHHLPAHGAHGAQHAQLAGAIHDGADERVHHAEKRHNHGQKGHGRRDVEGVAYDGLRLAAQLGVGDHEEIVLVAKLQLNGRAQRGHLRGVVEIKFETVHGVVLKIPCVITTVEHDGTHVGREVYVHCINAVTV